MFTNAAGQGLEVIGQRPLNVSAWPYTQADLESATHPHQLPRRDVNTVFIDHQLHGEAVKKWDWLRAETANTLENQRSRRCLSQFFHSLGVGGDNSWGARTHDQYTLPSNQPYAYGFTLKPVRAQPQP
jgi:beta-galactosidase